MFPTHKRGSSFAPLLFALALITACGDDPVEPGDPAEDLVTVRLTIGSGTVSIQAGVPGSVTIPQGASSVSAVFLDADGASLPISGNEFELRFLPANTAVVTFSRTGSFTGTLNGLSAGTTVVEVQLFHLEEQHDDFSGNLNLTVG